MNDTNTSNQRRQSELDAYDAHTTPGYDFGAIPFDGALMTALARQTVGEEAWQAALEERRREAEENRKAYMRRLMAMHGITGMYE